MLSSKALPVILSHESVSGDVEVLGLLLEASRAFGEAISENLQGVRVTSSMPEDGDTSGSCNKTLGLADWVSKRGHILGVFDISLSHVDSVPTCDMLERSLALGFKLAAESPKGLHLHSYEHHNGTASVRHILLSLPPLHLQHLHLCFEDESKLGAVVPALARLTGLTSLFLDSTKVERLMAGIAGFSRLRTLHCVTLESAAPLRSLPTSLQSLIVSVGSQLDINQGAVDAGGDPESPSRLPRVGFGPVQLAYLTHLTSLTSSNKPIPLSRASDSLPPHLHELCVELHNNEASDALTDLSALTTLTLMDPRVTSKQHIEALAAGLSGLKKLQLHCRHDTYNTNLAALPISHFCIEVPNDAYGHVGDLIISADRVTALSVFARTLRHLSLTAASDMPALVFEVTPKVLAGVVEQLTALESINMTNVMFAEPVLDDEEEVYNEYEGNVALFEAIAGLKRMQSVTACLPDMPTHKSPHPAAALAAAGTRLSNLSLSMIRLDDFAATTLVCALPNLRSLDLGCRLTNALLPVIAAQLQELTALKLFNNALVSDAGVVYLSRLTKLEVLSVPPVVSDGAAAKALRCESVRIDDKGMVHRL